MKIPFPLSGINKGRAASDQPFLTSPYLRNVRPYDTLSNKARGGQRPGLSKRYSQLVGGETAPIVAMCQITVVA